MRLVPKPDAEEKVVARSAANPEYAPMQAEYSAHAQQPRSAADVNTASAPWTPSATLTDYLREYAKGSSPHRPQVDIARDFGVSQPTVSRQLKRAKERAERKRARSEARMNMHGGFGGSAHAMHAPAAI